MPPHSGKIQLPAGRARCPLIPAPHRFRACAGVLRNVDYVEQNVSRWSTVGTEQPVNGDTFVPDVEQRPVSLFGLSSLPLGCLPVAEVNKKPSMPIKHGGHPGLLHPAATSLRGLPEVRSVRQRPMPTLLLKEQALSGSNSYRC